MANIQELSAMRRYFESGVTKPYAFRKKQLIVLRDAIKAHELELQEALYTDLKKSPEECWVTETGFLLAEINHALKHLRQWMETESVSTNLVNLPSKSYILREPLGVTLIIGPWNYPLQLLMNPLVGSMAAGNCTVLKASEFAPATGLVMRKLIEGTFDPDYIRFVDGDGATVIPAMMNPFSFDHVFYTGSSMVGRLIYKMAAERLVPVTLELGGKSPCVVESDANIKVAAKRIVMTKFSNAGQMCVAPDYVLVHESKKAALVDAMKKTILAFFGEEASETYGYGKIINEKQFDRLCTYLGQGKIIQGGRTDRSKLFIEPTLLDEVSLDAAVMHDEIFGPILPVISFKDADEARAIIARNPNPLAFYIFTSSKQKENEWLGSVAFGGGCVNNASWHLTNHALPFGGRGFSGTGQYHGRFSFETFSHKKSIMKTPTWFDPAIKYPPLKGKLRLFKWIIR
ncbi:MAG: aldehyde dehydrogenase [Chitinophagaceae bacterium]|nr:aldehyde dehydrogenase [Chitinophagaceae bacterium]MBL0055704.1 aldehyde dehydrogenase [Chitinophagaceae bacterium]